VSAFCLILAVRTFLVLWNTPVEGRADWIPFLINLALLGIWVIFLDVGYRLMKWGRRIYTRFAANPSDLLGLLNRRILKRHPLIGSSLRFLGILIFLNPFLFLVAILVLSSLAGQKESIPFHWACLSLIMLMLAAGFIRQTAPRGRQVGGEMVVIGDKVAADRAEDALKNDPRPPVLYLRSFKDDEIDSRHPAWGGIGKKTLLGVTEEQEIAKALREIGPFVAIGDPDENLPDLGAARLYVGEEWQQVIADLVQRSRLVVLRAGSTRGFWWEVEYVARHAPPEKILLLIPYSQAQYVFFCQRANAIFPKPLPPYQGEQRRGTTLTGVVYFEPDWTPRFQKIPGLRFLAAPLPIRLKSGLQPIFAQLGLPYRKPNLLLAGWVQLLIAVVKFSVIIILMYFLGDVFDEQLALFW
jgi:hypothetical protein